MLRPFPRRRLRVAHNQAKAPEKTGSRAKVDKKLILRSNRSEKIPDWLLKKRKKKMDPNI